MLQNPSCICSFATNTCMYDMKLFVQSLSYSNPGLSVVLFVDDIVRDMITELGPLNLTLTMVSHLNEYSNKNRDQMEKDGSWTQFQMIKSTVLDYCLNLYSDALFLDSDIFVINRITIPESCDLALSPHYIRKNITDRNGYYNGGCVWTSNKDMPSKWREFTKTSRYFDQASLEDCAKVFNTKEFGENYNVAWWRINSSQDSPAIMESYCTHDKDNIYFKGAPLIFVHTHFKVPAYNKFNNLVRNLLDKSDAKKDMCKFF